MEITFHGKRALVTGAGKGIGRDIAKKLVECGAETYALSRTQADLDTLKSEVPSMHIVLADLQDWDGSRKVIEQLGPIDLLVNNAGVGRNALFMEVKKEELDYVYDINVKSIVNVSQVCAKGMIERGTAGSIVNMSSIASSKALQEHTAYASSKAAVDMITKVMCLELGPHKIRVNAVNPTVVWTEMGKGTWSDPAKSGPLLARIPLNKFVEIEDVVNATLFLLSDKSAMVNGTCMLLEGGLSCS
ncbi:L-xylulose reductase-like [Mizuhopecten yessoensis]|uniref:L-xylulose reductase n=1 Tax=Mizuhopecten yessoensis TaxID=6573 RepID=A0A210PTG1_MIZYE|nr:L-xylulose reductase-like [Mizuhopecten yessoensis]OWF39734.1 L-xylulose reductase [Mizuhopecten yessoensis]